MKIFGNVLVKNEADVIVETLQHAAKWIDRMFVFDNGSTDGTWEKVVEFAKREPRVVPFKTAAVPFRDSLRSDTFRAFRGELTDGDWWCKLDSDELYIDNPREFLARVPRRHHVVWGVNFQFYFTDRDAARWEANPQSYPPHTRAEEALHYYRCDYSEMRFFRHRRRLEWNSGSAPRHLGVVHPGRIRYKHYQYRSPEQINLRLRTRQQAMAEGCGTFQGYNEEKDWREKIVPAASCRSIDAPNPFVIEEDRIPRHLERPAQRVAKHVMHLSGLWP